MTVELPSQLLTPHQVAVVTRTLDDECLRRHHIVVALSGAHAYGFPSIDSDFDLKGIHISPTASLVGLLPAATHADRLEIIEGVEVDYTSNEIGPVLQGILKGNSNYIERVLGALQPVKSTELESLRPLVRASLSQRMYRSYQGFAFSQLRSVDDPGKATAKKVLYVLRTTLTGAHALRTGEIQTDVTTLLDEYGFSDARELVELKRTAEKVPLEESMRHRWRARLTEAFAALDRALERSVLPEEPSNTGDVEAWLIGLRRRFFT